MEHSLRYWCFSCQKHFQSEVQVPACSICHCEAIQRVESNNNEDPSQFSVYQINNQQSQPTTHPQFQPNQQNIPQNVPPFAFPPLPFQHFSMNLPLGPPGPNQQLSLLHMNINLNNVFNTFQQITRQGGIFNLLNTLMGQNNLVAATQPQINRLQRIDKVKDCSICQQQQSAQQKRGYKLPCGHSFHIDCLNPWLQRTNTCPTCRAHI